MKVNPSVRRRMRAAQTPCPASQRKKRQRGSAQRARPPLPSSLPRLFARERTVKMEDSALHRGVLSFSCRDQNVRHTSIIFVSSAMNDVRHNLSPTDRVELLCWLTCGSLGAYYLNGSWPTAAFHVQAAHKWLDRHKRQAEWLAIAKLSAIAADLAQRHSELVDADWARDAVEEILDSDDLNYQSELVLRVLDECKRALADKRPAD